MTFENQYGIAVKDATWRRGPSSDLRYFVIAVLISAKPAATWPNFWATSAPDRARFKLLGTVRVLSAEGLVGLDTDAAACMHGLAINLINPGFMEILWTDPTGLKMLRITLVMMAFGIFWMWRIVKIAWL
jgi:tight adherence protein B